MKMECMLQAWHQYPGYINVLLRKIVKQYIIHVQRYNRENSELDIQEIVTPKLWCRHMSYTIKLTEW